MILFAIVFIVLSSLYFLNIGVTGFSTAIEEASVDEEVLNTLNEDGKASVIITFKEPKKPSKITGLISAVVQTKEPQQKVLETLSKKEFEKKHEYSIIKGFSGEITAEGLEKLRQNPNIEKIYIDKVYTLSLTDSIPLINASKTHPYQLNNQNITGNGETICILDTGIDTDHPDLNAKIIGCETFVDGTTTCEDDHGHGTHVTGIAAANGNLIGVAPDANIAMIKVCDSAGNCESSNILAGLEWCTNNKNTFNISVISMSLGDHGEYTSSTCPTDYYVIDVGIASAFEAGIFLVAASGNNDYTSGISHPACNENVTSAGATDKNDVIKTKTSPSDWGSNRGGDLLTILAPGVSITSTWNDGGTNTLSGTSMSAPHIAGAAAILQQYAKANSGQLSQSEINTALDDTGKPIYDSSSGGTYSRISVYEAVKSLTELSILSPLNKTYDTNISLPLNYIVNDFNLDSIWYNINGGENTILSGNTTFNTTESSQTLSLYKNDSLGNENSVSVSFTTDLTKPSITLTTQNNSYIKNPVTLSFSLTEQNPDSCSLYGDWNDWHLNQTKSASENSFTLNLEDGVYMWNIECNDTAGNTNFAEENYTINIDSGLPIVTIDSPQNTTYATNTSLELNFLATDNNLDSCWYSLDNNNVTLDNCGNTTFNTAEGAHTLKLFVNDSANNENYTEVSFTTDLTNPIVNLESPLNNFFSNSGNIQFRFKAIDANTESCNLYGSWDGWHLNQTKTEIVNDIPTSFDEIILEDGIYTWNVECIDTASNSAFNDTNYTLTVDTTLPTLVISSPENITYSGNSSLALNFVAVDDNLDSCWYSLDDSNTTITNCENTTFSTIEGSKNLKVYVKDKAGNEIFLEVSFTADISYPLISLSSPSEGASIESANFTYVVEDLGIANCSLLINGTVNSTDDSITTSATQEFSITLTDDRYYWSVSCVDNVNRENASEERNVIICTENWNCTEWSSCSDSQQTRTCTDLKSCGTTHSKPTESQSCSSGSSSSDSDSDTGAANSAEISSGEEDEEDEEEDVTPPPAELPETKPTEEKEEPVETEEITKEITEEQQGLITKAWNMLKNFKDWVTNPRQTVTSVSTRAVDGVKKHRIAATSFIFVIAAMVFTHFFLFKRYNINLTKKIKEKINIPKPNIVIPPKIKDLKANFKGIHENIKEKIKSEPIKKVHESLFKKIGIFKSYKDLLKPKKPE